MKLYLDNCCFNRPFDNQSQWKIRLESQAKLLIQKQIQEGQHQLVWSYVMDYENSRNPFREKRKSIAAWREFALQIVMETQEIILFAESLSSRGVKTFDALHIACAVSSGCDCFLTTDRKLLHLSLPEIRMINPVDFVLEQEEENE